MKVLIVLLNDLINTIKISEIKYDSSRRKRRIFVYVGALFLCTIFLGGVYAEVSILVDYTEYVSVLDAIVKVALILFLSISSYFSIRYILYSEAEILRIAALPLSTIEIMNVRSLEIVLKNVLLSLLISFSFAIALYNSTEDITIFLITCILLIPVSTYNIAHGAFFIFSKFPVIKTKIRILAIAVLMTNVGGLYVCCSKKYINIGILLVAVAIIMMIHYFMVDVIKNQFFEIVEHNRKKTRVYKLETESLDQQQAVLYKEIKMYLSDKLFIVNSSFGAGMLLIIAVLIATLPFHKLFEDNRAIAEYLYISIPVIYSMIISTCCTTYCSFSLEGKNMWIYQQAPITVMQIIRAKAMVNLLVSLPAIIISSCVGIIKTIQLSTIVFAMSFILPTIASVFISLFGCFIDMIMCNLEWENPQLLFKRTKTYPITLLAGMYLAGLSEVGVILLLPKIGINAVYCIICVVYLIIVGGLILRLNKMSAKFDYGM